MKIIQIIPANGWQAKYWIEEENRYVHEDLLCLALIECEYSDTALMQCEYTDTFVDGLNSKGQPVSIDSKFFRLVRKEEG